MAAKKKAQPRRKHPLHADGDIPPDHRGNRRCRRCGVLGKPGDVRHTEEFPDTPLEDRSAEITGDRESARPLIEGETPVTDLSLEVEAQDSPTLADLARYTGLSSLEIAAAKTDFHMSTCPLPVWECPDCAHRLKEIRAILAAVTPRIEERAREDERRKVTDEMAEQIADEIQALLADTGALFEWLAIHGLGDASPGATLAAYLRDLKGTCSVCHGAPRHAAPTGGIDSDGAPVAAASIPTPIPDGEER